MSGVPQRGFPTFCHISDFGVDGYRQLHRMIAISQPLVLWSPSSTLLSNPQCRVNPRDFVKLIEDGVVRIVGREPWLLDKVFRDRHPWTGARWDSYVDGAIRDIHYRDRYDPATETPRVAVAPAESGQQWARTFLAEHPEQVDWWSRVLTGEEATDHIPLGTLSSIRSRPWDPYEAAEYLLRSAHNHGQAMADARADVDFVLHRANGEFMRILAGVAVDAPDAQVQMSGPMPDGLAHERVAELANELLEILLRLDDVRGRRGLLPFVRSGGHAQLVSWFQEVCDTVKATDAHIVEGEILRHLRVEIERARHPTLSALFDDRFATTTTALSAAGAVVEGSQAIQDANLVNVLGVAISAFLIGAGMCKRLGLVRGSFTGPQWPYLYTYGISGNRRRRGHLLALLDNIA